MTETVKELKARKMREWRKSNPERAAATKKRAIEKNPAKHLRMARNTQFKRRYGITIDQFEEMRLNQKCECGICGIDPYKLGEPLVVDHDHETGKVRELLCRQCNLAIGYARESIHTLQKAIKYLRTHGS